MSLFLPRVSNRFMLRKGLKTSLRDARTAAVKEKLNSEKAALAGAIGKNFMTMSVMRAKNQPRSLFRGQEANRCTAVNVLRELTQKRSDRFQARHEAKKLTSMQMPSKKN